MSKEMNWIVLEDEGWNIIIPRVDSKPHSTDPEGKTRTLAYANCPCDPVILWRSQKVIHNSFADKEKVDNAMEKLAEDDTLPTGT